MATLRKKTLHGLFWSFLERFSVQGIDFAVSVVLARLLLPEEFGLVAMITVFVAIASTLRDSGLTLSLIRTSTVDEKDYSTVFIATLGLSLLIYCALFAAAPLIAGFFSQPSLTAMTRVLSLKIIVDAMSSVQATRLTKAMNFKKQLAIQVPSVLVGGFAGMAMAYSGFGVWSLVYMNLIKVSMAALQLWLTSDWRPVFAFDFQKFKIHYGFGYKLTLSALLDTIYQNIYALIIGKFFSAAQLGFYTRADAAKQLPVGNISAALNKVTYPMLAELQDDEQRLKVVYKKLMQQVMFWIAPTLIGAGVLAEPLFRVLFTDKWLPAVPYFQLLCVVGIMYPLHAYNLNVLLVKGRSDLFLRLEIAKKFFVTAGVLLVMPFGIFGLLYFQIVSTIVSFFINTHYSGRLINYGVWGQLKDILPILGMGAIMGFGCLGLDLYLQHIGAIDLARIGLVASSGCAVYLSIAHFANLEAFGEFKTLLSDSKS